MQATEQLFKQYSGMIYKQLYTVETKTGVPIEELIGIASERFIEAVESYDETIASFTTHLYQYLKRVYNKACEMRKEDNVLVEYNPVCEVLHTGGTENYNNQIDTIHLHTDIQNCLSENSQQYLQDLFEGAFQAVYNEKGGRPPMFPINTICEHYGWSKKETLSVKEEITEWWSNY